MVIRCRDRVQGTSIPNGAWIGFNRTSVNGSYSWTDTSMTFFTNWAVNQPDSLVPGLVAVS